MKKFILSVAFVAATTMSFAQVGIGTTELASGAALTVGSGGIKIHTGGTGAGATFEAVGGASGTLIPSHVSDAKVVGIAGAVAYCMNLEADGETINAAAQNIWRVPTIEESYFLINQMATSTAATATDGIWTVTPLLQGTKAVAGTWDAAGNAPGHMLVFQFDSVIRRNIGSSSSAFAGCVK